MRFPGISVSAVCVAFLFAGPAGAEGTICHMVAGSLHVGTSPPASLIKLPGHFVPLGAGLDAQRENDVVATLQKAGATPDLMTKVKQQAGCDTCGVTLTWLPDHKAGLVFNEAGDMHCVSVTAFKAVDGHLDATKVPDAFATDCPDPRLVVSPSDHGVYLAQEDSEFSKDPGARNVSVDRLMLSRWDGGVWGQPCQVSVAFPMRFLEPHLNCADGVDCEALRKIAVADAADAQDEINKRLSSDKMQEYTRIISAFPKDVKRFPDFKTKPHALSFSGDSSVDLGDARVVRYHQASPGRFVSFISQQFFPAPLTPKYPSWIVTEWLEGNGPARPVGGFVVHQKPGTISAVTAGPVPATQAH
jgi:hypothetical protein